MKSYKIVRNLFTISSKKSGIEYRKHSFLTWFWSKIVSVSVIIPFPKNEQCKIIKLLSQ